MILNYDKNNGFNSIFDGFNKAGVKTVEISQEIIDAFKALEGNEPELKKGSIQDAYDIAKAYGVANKEVVDFVRSGKGGFKEYEAAIQSASKQTTVFQKGFSALKTIGGTLLSTFANMAIMYAASAAIEAIGTAIYNTIHASEIAIEKGKEARDTISSINEEYNKKASVVDSGKRFDELRVGVNQSTNDNISLTNEQYSEYLSLCNEIAGVYPELVSSYDAQGNAILNLGTSAQTATEQLQNMLEVDQQIANFKIADNLQTAYDGISEEVKQKQDEIDELKESAISYQKTFEDIEGIGADSVITQLDRVASGDQSYVMLDQTAAGYQQISESLKNAIKEAGIMLDMSSSPYLDTTGDGQADSEILRFMGLPNPDQISSVVENVKKSFQVSSKDASDFSKQMKAENLYEASLMEKEMDALWNELLPSFESTMKTNPNFSSLSDNIQSSIMNAVSNIDFTSLSKEDSSDIEKYLKKNFLYPIAGAFDEINGDKTVQDSFNNLFSLDTSKLSVSEYETQVDNLLQPIHDYFDKVYGSEGENKFGDFLINFGFKVQTDDGEVISSSKDLMRSILQRVVDGSDTSASMASLNELTYEQLVNIETKYTDSTNGKSLKDIIEEETEEAQNTIDSTEPITFSSLFTSDEEGSFNKTIDEFQSNISSIDSALESLRNGEDIDLTDLTQQFPELAKESGNLQESLSDLKAKQIGDFAAQWKQFTADLDPSEMQYAQNFMKNFLSSMDFDGVDLSKVRSKILTALMPNPGELDSVGRQQIYSMVDAWIDAASANQLSKTMTKMVTDAQNAYSGYSSAISESMSDTGLTSDSISAIKKQFSELEGLDLNGLFINTAKGVKLNSDALEDLVDIQHKTKSANFADAIKKQSDAIKKYKSDTDSATKQTKEYKDTLSNMENELANIQNAQSQYHALYLQQKELFSDYSKWQNAQSTENAGDKYTNMVSGLKTAKEAFDKGLVGTDDFKSFAALISPTGAEDAVNFAENYAKAKRYLTEDVSGAKNFLNDLESKGLAEYNSELEQWSINVKDVAEASRQMGMGKDFMSAMFGRLEDYGFHNNVIVDAEDGVLKLSEAYSNLAKSEAELQEMESNPDNYNSTAIEAKRQEVEGYQRDVEELNGNLDYFVNNYADEYNQKLETAKSSIEMLNEKRKELLKDNKYGDNTSAIASQMEKQIQQWADEYNLELDAEYNVTGVKGDSLDKLKEFQDSDSGVISKEISLEYDIDSMSESEIDSKINELNNEKARIQVEVDGEEGQSAIEQIDKEVSALNNKKITLHIQQAIDSGTSIDELLAMENEELAATLSIDTSQVDEARERLESLQSETAETSISVKIDEAQFDKITQSKQATVKVTPEQEEIEVKVKDATVKVTPDPEEVEVSVKSGTVDTSSIGANDSSGLNVKVTVDSTDADNYQPSDKEAIVKFIKDSVEPDSYVPPDKKALAMYDVSALNVYTWTPPTKHGTVIYNAQMTGSIFAKMKATGTMLSPAHASGTAYNVLNMKPISAFASGKVTLPQNERALVNEEEVNGHSESIVRDGKWFLIPGGAHFENLKKGDLIFSAQQTDDLLKHGKIAGHARTYASGTIGNWFSNAYGDGSGTMWGSFQGGLANTGKTASSTPKKLNQAASNLDSASQSIAKSGDSLSDLIKKISDNVQDWIEVLISRTESKIEYYQAVYENRKSIKSKNANLTKAEDLTGKEVKYYKEAYKKYLSYADNVASQVGLSADLKKKVQEGKVDIQQLSEDDKNRVDAYMEWFNKAINARKAAEEKLTEQAEIAAKKLETITDIYDSYIDRTKAKQDLNDAKLEYREIAGMSIHESSGYYPIMKQQIAYEKSNIAMFKKEAKEYEKQLKAYGKKYGTNSKEYRELETTLIGVNQKYYESKTNLEKLNQQVREAKEQLKQWAVDIRGRAADKQAAARSYKQTADGYSVTEKDYTEQIKINNRQIDSLYALREEKAKNMELYSYNSDLYQEYADAIAQIDIEIMNLAEDSEEAKNAIMSLRWEPFYEAQEALDGVVNEYDTLRGLMDSDTFISDANGAFTENGLTNILLLQESMDATKSKIANYRAQIENLNEQYKNGCWSQEEYNEKLKELHDGLLDSATAMADYKQEMLDMYEAQLEKKNELMHEDIDAYQQALDAKKKYHEYDKKLKSQTKELNILKAQAAALEGVKSFALNLFNCGDTPITLICYNGTGNGKRECGMSL